MPAQSQNIQPGSEIIDATQNAVIEAVDNVSELIIKTEKSADFAPHAHEIFYQTPEFWVGAAFILVIIFLSKPIGKMIKNFLVRRRETIIDKISQAEKIRDDAQVLLAQYERKFLRVQEEVEDIIAKSEKEIELFKTQELDKLEAELRYRRAEVEAGIQSAAEKARKEINAAASNTAIHIVKRYLEGVMRQSDQSAMIDTSIKNILKHFNQQQNV